ncbi:GMC oxidoreductase [Nesterenkonia sp. CL21]|uniref:GMC oxidoreductase n=1 Tax=Nesterenkonia sp. CL21 TaxID=3064894 RepID=UPI0028792AC1|nr:GMC oxidoreductase [Nesterenkonia sp. CL21]MDS2173428.1 GMC oxidoreductase [Nesterenkonia sp. CL21]
MSRYPEETDVVIVGSGPTGATYARIIAETRPGTSVVMLEAGPTVSAPPGAHVKNIADPDERSQAQRRSAGPDADAETVAHPGEVKAGQLRARPGTFLVGDGAAGDGDDGLPVAAQSCNVGGMAAHWTGACPRPREGERVGFLPDLDALLHEAERLLGVTSQAFEDSPFGDLIVSRLAAELDGGRAPEARVGPMPLAVHRREDGALVWAGSDVVLGDVTRADPGFRLVDESLVTRVLVEDGQAAGVEVTDRTSGTTHIIRAAHVVVAADALRTPQLLWASGIRPTALGRYLNDQTQVVFAVRLRDVVDRAGEQSAQAEPGMGLSSTSGVTWVPYTDDEPFHGQIMQLDASPVPVAEDDPVLPGSVVGLGLFCAKDLSPEDRIDFSDERTDAFGLPAPTIRYRLSEKDHRELRRARERIVRWGRAIGEPLDDSPFTLPLGSSLHYQGTTRMGLEDDGSSVCRPDSELWDVPGVFVAGNGVIPTPTACNPTLTSVALAVRGAREIARRLSGDAERGRSQTWARAPLASLTEGGSHDS